MNKAKKIKVVIFHCGFIYSGGGERIVLEEAKGLIARGYAVEVYAPTLDRAKCFPEMTRELKVKTFFPSFIDWLPLRNALRMIVTSIFAPLFAYKFRDVDVFIGANQPGVWIAFCISRVLGKPYLVYLNQPNRIVYPRPVDREFGWYTTTRDYHFLYKLFQISKPLLGWLDKISVVSDGAILTNGRYIGGVIENIFSKKTIDCPAGAYAQAEGKLLKDKQKIYTGVVKVGDKEIPKPYLLITNRHDPQKRFDGVIAAFSKVLKVYKSCSLVIPGPFTEHSKYLVKLTKKLKIEDKVYFTGAIAERELQELYRQAAVYCYPSPEEDFGLGPLEAGGWGVPTVAWNHAGPTITVERDITGFLAEPYRLEDYVGCILKLLKNPDLRMKMGRAAWHRTRERFTWGKHIDTIENEIKKNVE